MKSEVPLHRSIGEIELLWREFDEDFDSFLPHQMAVLEDWDDLGRKGAHLVFYPTGTGKTKITLTEVAMAGYDTCVVLAPPITHNKWVSEGKAIGIKVIPMSHAKFRQNDVRMQRKTPVIVDEFHQAAASSYLALLQHLQPRELLGLTATPERSDGLPILDWFDGRIAAELRRRVAAGERVTLAFSGLRRGHRDRLRATGLPMRFLFLEGDESLVAERMRARRGHYMPVSLLDSQFDALEDPRGEADVTALAVALAPEEQLAQALAALV